MSLDSQYYDAVYIEDDKYLRLGWEVEAKNNNINLLTLATTNNFFIHQRQICKENTDVYIDQDLGPDEPKGDNFAKTLHQEGYKKLYMATGNDEEEFLHLPWLKVVGKNCPWSDDH